YLAGVDWQRRHGADLAAAVTVEDTIGLADEARVGQLTDALVERAIGFLVHLERDLPERASLVAPQRDQLLDGEPRVCDDLEHLGETARLMDRLDDDDLRDFHTPEGCPKLGRESTAAPPQEIMPLRAGIRSVEQDA